MLELTPSQYFFYIKFNIYYKTINKFLFISYKKNKLDMYPAYFLYKLYYIFLIASAITSAKSSACGTNPNLSINAWVIPLYL